MSAATLFEDVQKAAVISDCGRYRYSLERRWGDGPVVLFVMLNPSTADAEQDDPTIRRCIRFARSWGYDALLVANLYAYRASDPAELDRVADPIGRGNEEHLWRLLHRAALVVVAWGARPARGRYVNREKVMFWGPFYERPIYALGVTKEGHPRHPLYMPASARPIPFARLSSEGER